MERLHVNHIRDIIHRLRQGESQRQVARDLGVSRDTIGKYYRLALQEGYLDGEKELPPVTSSTLPPPDSANLPCSS